MLVDEFTSALLLLVIELPLTEQRCPDGWVPQSWVGVLFEAMPVTGAANDEESAAARDRLQVLSDDMQARWCCPSSCSWCRGCGYEVEGASAGLPVTDDSLARRYPASDGWTTRITEDGWSAKRTCPRTRDKQRLGEWLAGLELDVHTELYAIDAD